MPKAAFTTLGCKVNQYETQKILESFEEAGFDVVPFGQPADVCIVNSCSVTSAAEAKSRYTVRRAVRANPETKVVVTGCAAQMAVNKGECFPDADLLVPNPEKLDSLRWFAKKYPTLMPTRPSVRPLKTANGRTRATLKVQDGCDVHCSYCSIPYTRPGMKSRPWQEVLSEAQNLARQGFCEAVLTGVLIGSYGPKTGSQGKNFEELVGVLARESGLARIRISSIEMHQVTDPIIELAAHGLIAPHFHIPLQSGDTQVLRDMNRRYGQSEFLNLCARLYERVPGVSITTDIMVGFPTEDDSRFQSTLDVCEEAKFLKVHVFRFSPRFGTPADKWGDPVPDTIKTARARVIAETSHRTGQEFVRRFIGRTLRVLIEGKVRDGGVLEGNTDNWITVRTVGSPSLARTVQWVHIDEERDGIAHGEIVGSPALETNEVRLPYLR